MKLREILSKEDIELIKSECKRVREAGISIQSIKIGDIYYQPPKEE